MSLGLHSGGYGAHCLAAPLTSAPATMVTGTAGTRSGNEWSAKQLTNAPTTTAAGTAGAYCSAHWLAEQLGKSL